MSPELAKLTILIGGCDATGAHPYSSVAAHQPRGLGCASFPGRAAALRCMTCRAKSVISASSARDRATMFSSTLGLCRRKCCGCAYAFVANSSSSMIS